MGTSLGGKNSRGATHTGAPTVLLVLLPGALQGSNSETEEKPLLFSTTSG